MKAGSKPLQVLVKLGSENGGKLAASRSVHQGRAVSVHIMLEAQGGLSVASRAGLGWRRHVLSSSVIFLLMTNGK